MLRKEIHDLRQAVDSLETDIIANTPIVPGNITTGIQTARKKIKVLREALVGIENTRYYYECQKTECKQKCKLNLGVQYLDLSICMDTLVAGEGEFILVNSETVKE